MHSFEFPRTIRRYSAKKTVKPVVFICHATDAASVSIMGDFNQWDPAANPMIRQADGAWRVEVPLSHGHHQYLFVVDGRRMLDPTAQGIARNQNNEEVSLVAVS
jgi:1,4-alpha-glucan branching enzyme